MRNSGSGHTGFAAKLLCGASIATIAALAGGAAQAQGPSAQAAPQDTVEEIVVTGTSIRGVAPVGATVVSVGQQQIQETAAQTVQQVLQSVPSVVGLGAAGQGGFGSADASGTNAPTIHGLGASASNSTLILIDGHRIPLTGINHALADPNILPPLALQRVEVLAEGASSVYGSDAVAGVINFITRRRFDGAEANIQAGYGDHYHTLSAGGVLGKTWDTGSVMVAYGYSWRGPLLGMHRDFTNSDHRSQGGSNLASFACAPASIGIGSNIWLSPYTGAPIANVQANAPCDYTGFSDLVPKEERHSVMAKVEQQITDRLTVHGDFVYSNRNNTTRQTRGNVTTTVFGPGAANAAQINPFFVRPAGTTATSETVRWQADGLFGPGAHADSGDEAHYFSVGADYKITDDWTLSLGGVAGATTSKNQVQGTLCSSCANLALNGTTGGGGSLTAPSIPGTTVVVLNTPLTTANALDVWGNRTSPAVLADLIDPTATTFLARQSIRDATAKIDGKLFTLPAGDVRVAVGGELIKYKMSQDVSQSLNIGPAATGSRATNLDYDRNVTSEFAEVVVPLLGPDQAVPLIRRFDVNAAIRHDHYNDFGNTTNPKIGANWEVVDGLKLRGNFSKSFVAPALTSRGNEFGITAESNYGNFNGPLTIPLAAYPQAVGGIPGCVAGAATCVIGTAANPGFQINGGNKDLQPQKGKTWSFGADLAPHFAPGLRASLTYWHNEIKGAITAPTAAFSVNSAGLNQLLQIYPGGATPAQIAAATAGLPQNATLPPTVYFSYNFQQRNALNLWVEGIDFDVEYTLRTDDMGRFDFGFLGSLETKFDQQVGTGGAKFSVKNSTGFNTTFPSIKFNSRAHVGWSLAGVSADLFWNHTGSYRNWSNTTVTPIERENGVPVGGGDKVKSNDTFDAHLAYDFQNQDGLLSGVQIFLDGRNIFDKDPPFYNNNNGYDTFSGNPIGRVISIGARKRW
jgi:iron complex outermembrane receptor protein